MSSGISQLVKKYVLNPFSDSAMCHGDPFFIERRFVAWIDREDIRKIWNYVSRYRQEHGSLPAYSHQVMDDIVSAQGASYNAVNRWLGYCLREAERPAGEKRTPPFRFIDK